MNTPPRPSSSSPAEHPAPTRRQFVQSLAAGLGALIAPAVLLRPAFAAESSPSPLPPARKLGVALVGLGSYASGQLAPALQETEHCRLAGIVTGTPSKADQWKRRYQIPASCVYNYETMDQLAGNPEIDIVYVVTPNALHAEHVIRAARAGKHVICEKPMAVTTEECDRMIEACRQAGRSLGVGYRLHYEPHTREVMRLGQQKEFGPVKKISAEHSFVGGGSNWRYQKKLSGGGPLMDVGIYCVQAACYVTGEEPAAITARQEMGKFKDIEETIHWTMEFPSGAVAECVSSYAQSGNYLRVNAEKGSFELSPAYSYGGIRGKSSRGPISFPSVNQQARQMDAFALHVGQGQPNLVPGEMGRRDVRILNAIYEAAQSGKRVSL